MFNPDLSDYQLTSIITECCGGEAVVYSAVYKPNGQDVAVKRYFVKRYFVDKTKEKEHANLIQQEILTTKELQHPNILPYLTSFVHGRDLYVVSPLMSLGSCRDVSTSTSLKACRSWPAPSYSEMCYRHCSICINSFIYTGVSEQAIHLIWLSPELLQQNLKGYDACSDIYSVGVLACELANGAVPFADVPSTLMFTEKV
ncbi:unnamed protein product [Plutella xylostella]|uniref:(diamondback moth) hypothetical protein n=1 Tax=Plutella xylostella TaxID=51655 RepID=A0A8S4G9A0_PLUXY|nr:unnamed protein product [Plutella xylostella]